MKSFTDERVENYLYAMLPEREPVLQEMERQAKERDIPIVGPAVGRLFYQYARLINAKTVFEMGSAIGYSTIWWAKRSAKAARSTTPMAAARMPTKRAATSSRRASRIASGPRWRCAEVLSERKEQFDILFSDVDKHDYPRVFNMAAARVRKGGLFITDNALVERRSGVRRRQSRAGRTATEPDKSPKAWWSSTACSTVEGLVHHDRSAARRRGRGDAAMSSMPDARQIDILAIAAHRDDVEQTCGGTLLKMAERGHRTAILDLTQGEMGTRGTVDDRAREAAEAARILKVSWRQALDIPDGRVENTYENRCKVARVIRQCVRAS